MKEVLQASSVRINPAHSPPLFRLADRYPRCAARGAPPRPATVAPPWLPEFVS
uniref:Uncharacterized protein n=1 Tax=Arundo donax TaxID=35708 RepID=A0A0A8YVT6_ARUDO